ncbi:hypothetical protein CCL21_28490 [Pseudomonas syringae]|uniref:hypothetical protein n=1 Tax=Pseudomonas syringae TaxID=317 RepID=UPI000BB5FDCA|nr:hypothetical protein [Pseudomonas syringae]PBP62879.1 hypothetical protein CCL21_28490 [Pseudomonas syringae]
MDIEEVKQALARTEQTLSTAHFGLNILNSGPPEQKSAGLRNVLVFGRSVTFVIQNLKTIVGEQKFTAWYSPHQERMKADPLMKYFVEARNNLEKRGQLDVNREINVKSFNSNILSDLEKPPFDSTGFFVGDETGGSGWLLDIGDGEPIKYYVQIPSSLVEARQVFHSMPESVPEHLRELSTSELCKIYLAALGDIVESAKTEFLPPPRSRPHLRLVKG